MNILDYVENISDFRMTNKCYHKLSDIIVIGLFTYLSNGEDYEDMVIFAKTHQEFLREFCELKKGIPSHDTFNRVFSSLDPEILRKCLSDYGTDLLQELKKKQICFDGKKLKGADPTSKGNKGIYIVNAWVSENQICVGQKKVENKSNEITAIPALIDEIDIEGAVISIDAIGCQQNIVNKIIEKKGDYFLALKKNQLEIYTDVEGSFKANTPKEFNETWEYDHGRFETRKCTILLANEVLLEENLESWRELKTIVKIESSRRVNDQTSYETRYYISNEDNQSASYYNALARGHWGIENQLHWHLDVTFKEDACRARKGHAAENLSTLRKVALQIIKNHDDKLSLKKRRVMASYSVEYLGNLLR